MLFNELASAPKWVACELNLVGTHFTDFQLV